MVYVRLSRYGKSFLFINTYLLKLFFVSSIFFAVVIISEIEGLNLFSKNGLIFFASADAVIAVVSYLFLEDFDPVGYCLSLYWTSFAFLTASKLVPLLPRNIYQFSLTNLIFFPLIFALINGTVFTATRYVAGRAIFKSAFQGTEISKYYKDFNYQNLIMSVLYAALISADVLFYSKNMLHFLYPPVFLSILLAAFFASFFEIYITYELAFNLTVIFIIIIALLPILEFKQIISTPGFLKLILVLTVASMIIYLLIFKEQINPKTGIPTGAVVSTYQSDVITVIVLFIVWMISNAWIKFSLNYGTALFIMLPIAVGSIMSDTVHGHRSIKKIEKIKRERVVSGAVGGVGMGDGLWTPHLVILLFYLTFPAVFSMF